jgi:hypothetical protein
MINFMMLFGIVYFSFSDFIKAPCCWYRETDYTKNVVKLITWWSFLCYTLRVMSKHVKKRLIYKNVCIYLQCVAFNDISAQAPTHFMVVPKKPIVKLSDAEDSDKQVIVFFCISVYSIQWYFTWSSHSFLSFTKETSN